MSTNCRLEHVEASAREVFIFWYEREKRGGEKRVAKLTIFKIFGPLACLAAALGPLACLAAALGPLACLAAALGPLAWLT